MAEYRHPAPFAPGLEGKINRLVHDLVAEAAAQQQQAGPPLGAAAGERRQHASL